MKNKVMLVSVVLIQSFTLKQDELFNGETKFASGRINLPFNNTRKSEREIEQKAKDLKDKELILLHFNSNTGDVTYGRYFLLSEMDAKTKTTSSYLVRASDYKNEKNIATHPKYSDKNDRFYVAECFDEVLKNNPDIQQRIIEEGKLP